MEDLVSHGQVKEKCIALAIARRSGSYSPPSYVREAMDRSARFLQRFARWILHSSMQKDAQTQWANDPSMTDGIHFPLPTQNASTRHVHMGHIRAFSATGIWQPACIFTSEVSSMKNVCVVLALGILSLSAASLRADQLDVLGTADSFAVLGASTVTNTGPTTLEGNLGLNPGTSITGFPPGTVSGTTYANDPEALLAQTTALAGYNTLAALIPTQNLTGQDLGGLTLTPGVYHFDSSAQLTGLLGLNFEGLSNESFVFQIGSTLTTASASMIDLLNQGTNDSVYFDVGSSATLGTTTAFQGTILADQSITLNTGATIDCGSAVALNGAVTLDSNTINACGVQTVTPVPEPGTMGLVAIGALGGAVALIRRRRTGRPGEDWGFHFA